MARIKARKTRQIEPYACVKGTGKSPRVTAWGSSRWGETHLRIWRRSAGNWSSGLHYDALGADRLITLAGVAC